MHLLFSRKKERKKLLLSRDSNSEPWVSRHSTSGLLSCSFTCVFSFICNWKVRNVTDIDFWWTKAQVSKILPNFFLDTLYIHIYIYRQLFKCPSTNSERVPKVSSEEILEEFRWKSRKKAKCRFHIKLTITFYWK